MSRPDAWLIQFTLNAARCSESTKVLAAPWMKTNTSRPSASNRACSSSPISPKSTTRASETKPDPGLSNWTFATVADPNARPDAFGATSEPNDAAPS